MRTFLVPLDGSGLAERALPYVHQLVEAGDRVALVTVEEFLPPPKQGKGPDEFHLGRMEALERHCAALRARGAKAEAELLYGPPADTILAHARKVGAQVLVMSSHGRTGLGRILYGSVATRLLGAFEGEVVVVRPPRDALRYE